MDQAKWDRDYLALARWWADRKSKDPSTKVGAVLVNKRNSLIGLGYNGFPRGVEDSAKRLNDRPTKYQYVVHAEANAILSAVGETAGSTLYCTLFSCNECAKLVIQAGIKRFVAPRPNMERWADSHDVALTMYREAGVEVGWIDPAELDGFTKRRVA